jgi:hypothetical protein
VETLDSEIIQAKLLTLSQACFVHSLEGGEGQLWYYVGINAAVVADGNLKS